MKKLRVGVIGTGHLGRLHTKFFKEIENSELAGIYDLDAAKAAGVAAEFNVKRFDTVQHLLDEVDAVSIVSSTSSHYELAKMSLERGKHIFIEKPITKDIGEAEELIRLAASLNLKIQVGHIERFNPALLSLEKFLLDPKFIQTDRLAQFNPRGTDVAVVLDLMIHDIDIILSLVKSEVVDVHASGVAVVSGSIDIANARLEFENGAVANVTASRISQKKMRKMRIFQRDAYVSIDFGTGVSEVYRLVDPGNEFKSSFISFGEIGVGEKRKMIVYEQPEIKEVNALKHEIQLFVDAVLNDSEPVVNGLDGLKALRVAEIILNKISESQIK